MFRPKPAPLASQQHCSQMRNHFLPRGGVQTAWLSCAIGNDRAARFYEKSGWRRAGTFVSRLDTIKFDLEVWQCADAHFLSWMKSQFCIA
jgi:RimJ/RimL family protein N-acetyltransferase